MGFVTATGRACINFLSATGRLVIFAGVAVSHIVRPPFYSRLVLRQIIEIGFYSLPVVGLTAIFTGMVLALQSYTGFARFNAESAVATVVVLSITRELAPVLAGLMIAGRIGAAMAAEIGTMRVTEQIDALSTLSTNPYKYLVVPRLVAGVVMLPCCVLVADIIGVFGGYLVSVYKLGFNANMYIKNTVQFLEFMDVFFRPRESCSVWFSDFANGLLPRVLFERRCTRCWFGNNQRSSLCVCSYPWLQLPHHRSFLF